MGGEVVECGWGGIRGCEVQGRIQDFGKGGLINMFTTGGTPPPVTARG